MLSRRDYNIIMCNTIVREARIENRIYCFAYTADLYSMLITISYACWRHYNTVHIDRGTCSI